MLRHLITIQVDSGLADGAREKLKMKNSDNKWKTAQQVEWRKFCDAMDQGREQGVKVFATLKDSGNKESARRWLFGATAAQKRESAARQLAVNDTKSVMREVDFMTSDAGFMARESE